MTMKLTAGMRARCVHNLIDSGAATPRLTVGKEYGILGNDGICITVRDDFGDVCPWYAWRFKPVIRVKAPCKPSLDILMERFVAKFNAMSPEDQEAHLRTQRESWVRGEVALRRSGLG